MTPDEIYEANELLEEYKKVISLCKELYWKPPGVYVGQMDIAEHHPELIPKIATLIWDALRERALSYLKDLEEFGIDTSEQRKKFDEHYSEFRRIWK
jgi:hypothetical protein